MVIQFSSVDYIRALKNVNFTDEQAELIAKETELLVASIEQQQNNLNKLETKEPATKGDLREVELRLQKEIEQIKSQLILWVLGIGVATIVTLVGAMFTLFKIMLPN